MIDVDAFVVTALLVLAMILVTLGYQLARVNFRADQERLELEQAALAAEWRHLDRTRRIRAMFLAARIAMRGEADRHSRSSTDDR